MTGDDSETVKAVLWISICEVIRLCERKLHKGSTKKENRGAQLIALIPKARSRNLPQTLRLPVLHALRNSTTYRKVQLGIACSQ